MNYETLYNNIQAYAENTEALFVASIPVFVQQAEERIYNSVQLATLRKNVTGTLTTNNKYLTLPSDWLAAYSLAVIDSSGNYSYLISKDVNFIREAYPQPTDTSIPKYYGLFDATTFIVGPTPDQNYSVEMHYFYYPPTIVQGQISTLNTGSYSQGSAYTNGVYQNIPMTGGFGQNATADIVVSGGVISSVSIKFGGQFYIVGDILSADSASIGGSGSGFSITVATVTNTTGTSWLGDHFDSVLFYGAMREAMLFMKGEQDLINYYEQKYQEALHMLKRLGDGLDRSDSYRTGQLALDTAPEGGVIT